MFTTTTNINSLPVSAIQIMNTPNNHSTLATNPSWRLTTPTPSVVSIINGNSSTFYIATQSSPTTNIIRQSPQTVRLVSPSFTILNNSNTTITGQPPLISSSNNNFQSGICIDTSLLGRLATSTIQRQTSENIEEKVEQKNFFFFGIFYFNQKYSNFFLEFFIR
jgi:hypothetical protein